ncbi:MAG: hypothetical protein SGI88_17680 [Candidatus Hydrogenedentes bacterium]|nr:hypothetical protein [Candidatus Hydrogenedentota bacterium]
MKRIGKIIATCALVAVSVTQMGCPNVIERFTIRVVNNSSDIYVVSVFLAQLQGQNITVVSDNLLNDDVDPANEDEFSVLLSLADSENANAIGFNLEDLNGNSLGSNAVLSEGFVDGVTFTLTIEGSHETQFDFSLDRELDKAFDDFDAADEE